MRRWWTVLQRVGNWVLDRVVVLIGLSLLGSAWQAYRLGASAGVVVILAGGGLALLIAMAVRGLRSKLG